MVWNLWDGNNSIIDISQQLSKKLKQPITDDLVWLALDQLKADNMLADNGRHNSTELNENLVLQKRVKELEMENEILKKADLIFVRGN